MIKQIVSKWESCGIYITGDGRYFTEDCIQLIKEEHQGQLKYRIPKTSKRYSYKMLNENKIKAAIEIIDDCPF